MKRMKRVILIVLDGVGIGALPDAHKYGDAGANTLGHVMEQARPSLPNLSSMGLGNIGGWQDYADEEPIGCFGSMAEKSPGKDTTTGHWELAGLQLNKPFPTYPDGFPKEVIDAFERETGMKVYTSADSVFQIAAHESVVPPLTLWDICRQARRVLVGDHAVGRVIARPFTGEPGSFVRTDNRKDFSVDPLGTTMLDVLKSAGMDVLGVGKIEDIFNHRGLTRSNHVAGNPACIDATLEFLKKDYWRGLRFVNLVDTDMKYGHRNDVQGFAASLEEFDKRLPEIIRQLKEDDLLIITADHGCDPADVSTDHTREYVPLLVWGLGIDEGVELGVRNTFADVAKTALDALGVKNTLPGKSFYADLNPMD